MRGFLASLLLFSTAVFADYDSNQDSFDEESDDSYEPKRVRYEDMPDSSILRDEAHWPSQNQDPFLESLSR